MSKGRVYLWTPSSDSPCGGSVAVGTAPLLHLDSRQDACLFPMPDLPDAVRECLWGRYVRVRNGGMVNELDPATGSVRSVPIGDARPNAEGDFLFEPGRGGGRMDKLMLAEPDFRWRYIQAAHFGEVNTYFYLDHIAAYIDELLHELHAQSFPYVTAVVNAHHAATEMDGIRDGVRRSERWLPFQGGHYRLPSRRFDIAEHEPLSAYGEIHLGPGWQLLDHGALVDAAGGRYRANASHNAGILYHEYGHHITRYTADFMANEQRRPERQHNRKPALDEGTCDYWAATLLHTPHIWAWHRRHDEQEMHPRSLVSCKTLADYDSGPKADPHANGTIWGAALWDMRSQLLAQEADGRRQSDLLVLKTLLLLGQHNREKAGKLTSLYRTSAGFVLALNALLLADEMLYAARNRNLILATFSKRGIRPSIALSGQDVQL